jgi:hypothetical protein
MRDVEWSVDVVQQVHPAAMILHDQMHLIKVCKVPGAKKQSPTLTQELVAVAHILIQAPVAGVEAGPHSHVLRPPPPVERMVPEYAVELLASTHAPKDVASAYLNPVLHAIDDGVQHCVPNRNWVYVGRNIDAMRAHPAGALQHSHSNCHNAGASPNLKEPPVRQLGDLLREVSAVAEVIGKVDRWERHYWHRMPAGPNDERPDLTRPPTSNLSDLIQQNTYRGTPWVDVRGRTCGRTSGESTPLDGLLLRDHAKASCHHNEQPNHEEHNTRWCVRQT